MTCFIYLLPWKISLERGMTQEKEKERGYCVRNHTPQSLIQWMKSLSLLHRQKLFWSHSTAGGMGRGGGREQEGTASCITDLTQLKKNFPLKLLYRSMFSSNRIYTWVLILLAIQMFYFFTFKNEMFSFFSDTIHYIGKVMSAVITDKHPKLSGLTNGKSNQPGCV